MTYLLDVIGLVGFLGIGCGLWAIYPPLALIVCGGLMLTLALIGARNVARKK